MSVAQAVRFRLLFNKLDRAEVNAFFISHIDVIVTSLFDHIKQPRNDNVARHVNQAISDVIKSRKSKTESKSKADIGAETLPMSLHDLPHALVGKTASFLTQKDYAHFSRSCRTLYISCHAPNMLRFLDLRHCTSTCDLNLSQFRSVRSLAVRGYGLEELVRQRRVLPRLRSLLLSPATLRSRYPRPDEHQSYFGNYTNFTNRRMFRNLPSLICVELLIPELYQFIEFLCAFPNLRHLQLDRVLAYQTFHFSVDTSRVLPKLWSMELDCGRHQNPLNDWLLTVWSKHIKHLGLKLRIGQPVIWHAHEFRFESLKFLELATYEHTATVINDVCASAVNLKRVTLHVGGGSRIRDVERSLKQLFARTKITRCTLSYERGVPKHMYVECVMRALQSAILENTAWRAGNELILLVCIFVPSELGKDLVKAIRQTVELLDQTRIEHIAIGFVVRGTNIGEEQARSICRVKGKRISVAIAEYDNGWGCFLQFATDSMQTALGGAVDIW